MKIRFGMKRPLVTAIVIIGGVSFAALLYHLSSGGVLELLTPKGLIAREERTLMSTAAILMVLIVMPVYALTVFISLRFRVKNTKHAHLYRPNWEHNVIDEFLWWLLPCVIILFLSILTWKSTHELDPYRPLRADQNALEIQVVALNWKWLFIYPQEGIASVNSITIPVGVPVAFSVTADAPMNSFWIPQLGGQIYAMTGMTTKLHLIANQEGVYQGRSANMSGEGFAGMTFTVNAVSQGAYEEWVRSARKQGSVLSSASYAALREPSRDVPPALFGTVEGNLYDKIVDTFMYSARTSYGHDEASTSPAPLNMDMRSHPPLPI